MTLQELLKNDPDTLSKVQSAIDAVNTGVTDNAKKIKFVDLSEGGYVSTEKHNALQTKFEQLKNAENPFETKYNELVASGSKALEDERTKLGALAKKYAVDAALGGLGVQDKLTLDGIKSHIDLSKITLDENYAVTGGLSEQIESIKTEFKSTFEQPTQVSTGSVVPESAKAGTGKRVYTSRAEVEALTPEEVAADYSNIISQLGNLK